jgi:hypothetical protein
MSLQADEEQHVPIAAGEPRERAQQGGAGARGGEIPGDRLLGPLHLGVGGAPFQCAVPADLPATVPGDQPGGDAQQPRPGVAEIRVVRAAPAERDEKGVPDEVLGDLGAEPQGHVPVDRPGVAVEQRREPLRVLQGLRDDVRVVHRGQRFPGHHHGSSPIM